MHNVTLSDSTHMPKVMLKPVSPRDSKLSFKNVPEDVRSTLIAEESDGGDNEGWYIQKYPGRDGEIYVNNPKVIRLSEVYLIAAEAALKAGGADPASYINDLRKQRIADYEDVASVTIDDILTERRLELYGEGHNAWDTWRNKKAVTNAQVPARSDQL